MPRKIAVNMHDELVRYCMTAALGEVASLLTTATAIVKVRSQQAAQMAPNRSGVKAKPVIAPPPPAAAPATKVPGIAEVPKTPAHPIAAGGPPAGQAKPLAPAPKPPKPPTTAAAAGRQTGPRKNQPPPATTAATSTTIPKDLPPQDAVEE